MFSSLCPLKSTWTTPIITASSVQPTLRVSCANGQTYRFCTGEVLEWVRSRIRSASLVVADLTDSNPNVYLEIGYAWGVGVRTVLIVKKPDQPKFDVRGHRYLEYASIQGLEESLTMELKGL